MCFYFVVLSVVGLGYGDFVWLSALVMVVYGVFVLLLVFEFWLG